MLGKGFLPQPLVKFHPATLVCFLEKINVFWLYITVKVPVLVAALYTSAALVNAGQQENILL